MVFSTLLEKEHKGYNVSYVFDSVNNQYEIHQSLIENPCVYSSFPVDELAETPEEAIGFHIEWIDEQEQY